MLSTIKRIKTILGNGTTGAALLARVPPPRKTKTNNSSNRGSQSPVPDARRRHAWKMNPKFSPSSRAFDTCRWFISNASSRRDDRDLALSWAGVWLFPGSPAATPRSWAWWIKIGFTLHMFRISSWECWLNESAREEGKKRSLSLTDTEARFASWSRCWLMVWGDLDGLIYDDGAA